ncbi:MAG: 3'(2'),5'-bisphosphate nucleotidase CysQ [Ignavibacteriae bacterium]|nr:3'(2'),5'-bisphosphate nucleotidase CysQ [Ignavibacteriota bacterium]NOG98616.1 3'(2'),5'-bisphosphate nucleotidase CysQ [Ignavibacteriota bacterium]
MINKIIEIALSAGKAILNIYNSADFGIEMKDDNSPLTLADRVSHEVITEGLKKYFPEIPILSEEGKDISYDIRKDWQKFWLVDPLDGTKEFIKKNGEFTVNIALIESGKPSLGVIYAPALEHDNLQSENEIKTKSKNKLGDFESGVIYFADKKSGAFKQIPGFEPLKISVTKNSDNGNIAVKSRSHSSEEEEKILTELNVVDSISTGSSLKFCMVAEGKAQIYYRHGPTNEWDVGAGYAIAKYAGANIKGLEFNKENILNDSFLVSSIENI